MRPEVQLLQDVFEDFKGRRLGVLKALTTEVDLLYAACDPDADNLCLYGMPDGSWEVNLPAEEVPPEMPEPALGINFSRTGMQRKDWLSLVAIHSDAWLMAVAFYNGARLNREGRAALFDMLNILPTCFEEVTGKSQTRPQANNTTGRKRPGQAPARPRKQVRKDGSDDYEASSEGDALDEDEGESEAGGGYQDGEGDPCPNCGRIYKAGEFWIACDNCDTWYDGKCVNMTAQKAQKMGKWNCPRCT